MSTDNQKIAEAYVDGPELLALWNKTAALRIEFDGDFEAYAAYSKAAANGQIRVLGGK